MMRNLSLWCLLSIAAVCVGCSSGTNLGLRGKVTYSDDNSPVPVGMVVFSSTSAPFTARADIKPDGTFTASSTGQGDGLPAGTYKVFFTGVEKVTGQDAGGMDISTPLIDAKYYSAGTSGLEVVVDPAKKNTMEIKVERYKKK
ncbi:MAG: hypothetical protein ACRC46_12860 [Thermoguttaceae bacterium]